MTTNAHTVPAAILAAGAFVGLGLYLGLTRAPVASPGEPAASPPAAPAPPELPPATAPVRPAPQLTPAVQERAQENAARALAAWRDEFRRRCWDPAAAAQPEPRQVPLTFNLSFAPDGNLVVAGIAEDRAANRSDVANCLRQLELGLKIPAPGVPVYLEVPFTLP